MQFKSQRVKLPVANFDTIILQEKKRVKCHGCLLPHSIRAVFYGLSNCGKTNALLALILHPNGLKFDNVYVYSKSLKQPKYKFLERILNDVDEVEYCPFSEHEEVIPANEVVTSSTVARHIFSSAHSLAQTTDRAARVSITDRFSLPQVA